LFERIKSFEYLRQVLIGFVSGCAALVLLIAGLSISSGPALPSSSASNQAQNSSQPSASATPTDSRTCSVAEAAADTTLGTMQAVVVNQATNEVLFDRNSAVPGATASALKLLTATAALQALGPNYRVSTRVYQDSADPGTIYVLGAGDPTLSRTSAGKQSVYRDAPKLATLAIAVNAAVKTTPITKIILDSSVFQGASWESSWERSEQTIGYMSEVTALQVDGDRNNPQLETSPRSTTPVLRAGNWFKQALGASATGASISLGKLPTSAIQIAQVQSQPISKWILHMLQVSDNTEAEALARLVSIDGGFDGTFGSIDAAIKRALSDAGLNTTGLTIKDGSGLSANNSVPPAFFTQLMQKVFAGTGYFSVIKQALPVSGESGSLAERFKGKNLDAAGHVFAKTGWIKNGYTLVGYTNAKDGTVLLFAVYALGKVTDTAKLAIDNLVAGFYRCGANLSNQ
jgi:D-alanyl-D-alanine carboxypeptidase/D-alanyl-D-alanine-endopeptidase (penicillin-binding protein 4)